VPSSSSCQPNSHLLATFYLQRQVIISAASFAAFDAGCSSCQSCWSRCLRRTMGRLQPTKAPCLVRQIVTSWTACMSSLKVWGDADGVQQLQGTAAASRQRSKAGQGSGGCAQKQLHDSCHMIKSILQHHPATYCHNCHDCGFYAQHCDSYRAICGYVAATQQLWLLQEFLAARSTSHLAPGRESGLAQLLLEVMGCGWGWGGDG